MSIRSIGHDNSEAVILTVITAAFNAAKTIDQTLRSGIALGSRVELIVVDDGSTDKTAEIVQSFGSGVHLISQPNKGKSASRNRALQQAQGEYVLFLDADDMVLSSLLGDLLEAISIAPKADVFYGHYYLADEHGEILSLLKVDELSDDPIHEILVQNRFGILATICRAEIVRSVGGFDLALRSSEDWDLWIRLAQRSAVFHRIDKPLSVYRLTPGSNSKDFSRMWKALKTLQEKHKKTILSMPSGKQIMSRQLNHLLDRDLRNVYGDDLADSWLKRRINRSKAVIRLTNECPGILRLFIQRLFRRIIRV